MQDGFHLPQEVGSHLPNTPLLFEVRFQSVFFKMTPTVSWEIVSTTPNSTNWSASNLRDHWLVLLEVYCKRLYTLMSPIHSNPQVANFFRPA